jgi:hypothetical protein
MKKVKVLLENGEEVMTFKGVRRVRIVVNGEFREFAVVKEIK